MASPKPISLTFDNGPDSRATPQVLRTLAEHDVRAAFFAIGRHLAAPGGLDLVRRAHDEGHRIGNHTYSHGRPFGALDDPLRAIDEIERTQALLESVPGVVDPDRLFRPNGESGGRLNDKVMSETALSHLKAEGYTCILWNSVPGDWMNPDGWVEKALEDARRLDWPLIVIHDLPTGAMDQLPTFIRSARDLGCEFTADFPVECVPLRRGAVQWDMTPLTTAR